MFSEPDHAPVQPDVPATRSGLRCAAPLKGRASAQGVWGMYGSRGARTQSGGEIVGKSAGESVPLFRESVGEAVV